MIFADLIFLLGFLPAFFLLYFLVPNRFRNWVALVGSVFSYAWGAPVYVFVVIASAAFDVWISRKFESSQRKSQTNSQISGSWLSSKSNQWLLLFLSQNLGFLLYFKYYGYFSSDNIALPLGISFFTFQKISYGLDVFRGEKTAARNFKDYLLYVLLFPQLVMGPIVRYKDMERQIANRQLEETWENRLKGLFRFIIGLSRKVLIANPLSMVADQIFALDAFQLTTPLAWLGLITFAFYIYFDFAGYADMAIGLGRMMGFHLPENFKSPYIARSMTEFWQRWHITLGTWFRDYLYRSIRGNKKRIYLSLWAVFLLMALWHGASLSWLIWGVYNGVFITLERKFLADQLKKWPRFPMILYGFGIVLFGMVLFKLQNLVAVSEFYKALLGLSEPLSRSAAQLGLDLNGKFWFIFSFAAFFSFIGAFPGIEKLQAQFLNFEIEKPEQKKAENRFESKGLLANLFLGLFVLVCSVLLILCLAELAAFGFKPFLYLDF